MLKSLSIIILIEIYFFNCYIVLPIDILQEDNYISKDATNYSKIMSKEFFTPLITYLDIGTPKQIIPLLIKPKKNYFIFNSNNTLNGAKIDYKTKIIFNFTTNYSKFNENDSSSYTNESCTPLPNEASKPKPIAEQICPANDTIYFYKNLNNLKKDKKTSENKVQFYLTKNTLDDITGIIGLNSLSDKEENTTSFISIFKNKKIIDNYNWYFDFDEWNGPNGKLIIGKLPHEIKNNLQKKNLNYTNKSNDTNLMNFYEMKFAQVYFNINKTNASEDNYNLLSNETIEFNFESNVIVGAQNYKLYFDNILKDLITQKNCTLSNFKGYEDELLNKSNVYNFYYCNYDNDTMNYLNEVISSLYFYSSELNYTFEISKEQIIRVINNTIFINIVFNQNKAQENKWVLGKPFIFKYNFVFDSYNGKIGFYNKKSKKDKNDIFYKLLIIIPLIIYLCVGAIIIAVKKLRKNDNDKDNLESDEVDTNLITEENNLKQNIIN